MSYPQGYLYQPPGSLGLYSCSVSESSGFSVPKSEEPLRSSPGSAFSPFSGSVAFTAPVTDLSSHLRYNTDHAAGFTTYMGTPYDANTAGMAGEISYSLYGSSAYPHQLNDPVFRKHVARDTTATLKAWLQEHEKNPYPTKGEKIMLAIITRMTLTQVSTWFANARRRLKKDNHVKWAPRSKNELENEEHSDGERNDDYSEKSMDNGETSVEDEGISLKVDSLADCSCSAESDGERNTYSARDLVSDSESAVKGLSQNKCAHESLTERETSVINHRRHQHERSPSSNRKASPVSRHSSGTQTQVVKPKLWSLVEIATSDQKQYLGQHCPSDTPTKPKTSSARTVYPASSVYGGAFYYTSSFYSNYQSYGQLGHFHGQGLLRCCNAALADNEEDCVSFRKQTGH